MIVRVLLILFLTIGLAGFGGVAWYSTRTTDSASAEPVKVTALVMARSLPAGSLLKPEDLAVKELEQAALPPGGNLDTTEVRRSLNGAMLRRSAGAGDLVLSGDVTRPGDHGFLAAVLQPGMRAVTVGVDAVSGTAGLIWPGDHIDLIMTQSQDGANVPVARRVSAETVLENARVIAIDQRLVQGASPNEKEGQTARTVTLEVTEEQASRVAVASRIGRLSLSVRAAELVAVPAVAPGAAPGAYGAIEAAPVRQNDLIWAGDVSRALPSGPDALPEIRMLRIYQGAGDSKEFRF
jgi:pilus assembly protein CpaB